MRARILKWVKRFKRKATTGKAAKRARILATLQEKSTAAAATSIGNTEHQAAQFACRTICVQKQRTANGRTLIYFTQRSTHANRQKNNTTHNESAPFRGRFESMYVVADVVFFF